MKTPQIRNITIMQPLQWLALGWRDMVRCGWFSLAHGLVMAILGGFLVFLAHDKFWLLASAFSAFLVIAPVLATSLYALSRALQRGEKADLQLVFKTWTNWQRSHDNKFGNDYWALVQFGGLLAVAAVGWILTTAAFVTLMSPAPVNSPMEFVRSVMLAKDGYVFELWLGLGGLLAAPVFASSVVSMPLLLDRRVSLKQAVLTSWRTVLANPVPLAFWSFLIMSFTLIGLASALLGLVVIVPVLGHASWHAYRDLVDATGLPDRDAKQATQVLN